MPMAFDDLPQLYKGVGPGTYWHQNEPEKNSRGFSSSSSSWSRNAVISHITAKSAPPSPFLSFSTSFAVARGYAIAGKPPATKAAPGYVYVIDLSRIARNVPQPIVINPIEVLSANRIANGHIDHGHTGDPGLLHGLGGARGYRGHHRKHVACVATPNPPFGGTPTYNDAHKALIFALRDGEVLVLGTVPTSCFVERIEVY